jgi:hypothetical protein
MSSIAASFKPQFPDGENEVSIINEILCNESFDKVNLNIDWQLYTDNKKKFYSEKIVLGETSYKHCLGSVVCNNNSHCSHSSCTKSCPEKQACPSKVWSVDLSSSLTSLRNKNAPIASN